ncbi:hypothetical protein BHE74_00026834 [Ensete ventricosum]|nr:hypothetical protein BHE74_00026834 [Ensete ventricosum]RZR98896.1 hypothetical protein BHM03_00028344 [Ensete ventricosum]
MMVEMRRIWRRKRWVVAHRGGVRVNCCGRGNTVTEVPLLVEVDAAAVKHEEDCLMEEGQYAVVALYSKIASAK